LISTIALGDGNFQHTVLLLCEHSESDGSYGLILNRPIEASKEILEQAPFVDGRLFQGGPVQRESLQVIHPYGDYVPGARKVLSGVYYGGDFSLIKEGIDNGGFDVSQCRFFLGYAGWRPDQLQSEVKKSAWIIVEGDDSLILQTPPQKQWSQAIKSQKQSDPLFENFPENPEFN